MHFFFFILSFQAWNQIRRRLEELGSLTKLPVVIRLNVGTMILPCCPVSYYTLTGIDD
jgi:hypothetical protein